MNETRRHIILISGKDSLAAALVQTTRRPELPYEFFNNDVGAELPETYAWLDMVAEKTGWDIQRIGADLKEGIRHRNGFLPSNRQRYCTRETKIEPTVKLLKGHPSVVYYGLRADENRTGYQPLRGADITPVHPLQEMGIDLRGVYAILDAQNLAPPSFFWPRLHAEVSRRMTGWGNWESKITRMERDILFAGRSRGNCSFCFYQRLYEYVWLAETHPDLFDEACAFEKPDYTWKKGYPLRALTEPDRAAQIFESRVRVVCKTIIQKFQLGIFGIEENEISLTSCGLLCGK